MEIFESGNVKFGKLVDEPGTSETGAPIKTNMLGISDENSGCAVFGFEEKDPATNAVISSGVFFGKLGEFGIFAGSNGIKLLAGGQKFELTATGLQPV
jgi:hypothetical protein